MLDSGVFSAWNRDEGKPIILKDYIAWLLEHRKWLFSYVNVDVIPGKFGEKRTQKMVEDSAKGGYDNLQEMKSHGLKPIPVFHQGERFYWLERMLADGDPYIGIANAKDLWGGEQLKWLDEVFSIICGSNGRPLVKTHGFGITRPAFLFRFPWTTVDSTTWSLTPGFGQVLVPVYKGGKPDYLRPPVRVVTSGIPHKTGSNQRLQFENLGPTLQEHVRKFLADEVGCTVAEARYGTSTRRRAVLTYYCRLMENIPEIRFKHHVAGVHTRADLSHLRVNEHDRLKIMFATSLSREWSWIMNTVGARTRLLSYYELRERDSSVLIDYVTNGIVNGDYVKRAPKRNWLDEGYMNHRRLRLAERVEAYENGDGAETAA